MRPQPDFGEAPSPVVAQHPHFFLVPRFQFDGDPVVLAPVDLGEDKSPGSVGQRRVGRRAPQVHRHPGIGVEQAVLQQRLAAIVEQVGGAARVAARSVGVRKRPEPRTQVAGEPDDEPVERLLDRVGLNQLAELLQLHAVGGMGPERAAPQVDGDRVAPADRGDDVQVTAVEGELEAIDLQPGIGGNAPGRLWRRLAQFVVEGGRAETAGVFLLRRDRRQRDRHRHGDRHDERCRFPHVPIMVLARVPVRRPRGRQLMVGAEGGI